MRLVEARLRNFQPHREATFRFGPGLNAVLGPTDSGKSSLVRAIRWVVTGEPPGLDYLSEGASEASVTLAVEDGEGRRIEVEKVRSEEVNRYVVRFLDAAGLALTEQRFDKFGKGVPEEVRAVLPWGPALLGRREVELGFWSQHDPAFMLGWTGRERAEVLDSLCGNDVLTWAATTLNSDVSRLGREENERALRIEGLRSRERSLGDPEGDLERAQAALLAAASADAAAEAALRLGGLGSRSRSARRERASASAALALLRAVPEVEPLRGSVEEVEALKRLAARARKSASTRRAWARVDPGMVARASAVEGEAAGTLLSAVGGLRALRARVGAFEVDEERVASELASARGDLVGLQIEMRGIVAGRPCPFCGRFIMNEEAARIAAGEVEEG